MDTVHHPKSFIVNKYFCEIERAWNSQQGSNGADTTSEPPNNDTISSLFSQADRVEYGGTHNSGSPPTIGQHQNSAFKPVPRRPVPIPANAIQNNADMRQNMSKVPKCVELTDTEDLIYLPGPLTEDAIIRTLQARFYKGLYYTNVGPILLAVNPYNSKPESRVLCFEQPAPAPLKKVVKAALQQLQETSCSQTIVLNGCSGSGKTHTSLVLLRQLFDIAGGGGETDTFKHLNAALTVLKSLTTASTVNNKHASRVGYFIESHITDSNIYKTKIHCCSVDESRVVRLQQKERNFQIFYQVLAGLTPEEKVKYHLEGYSVTRLKYLNTGDTYQDVAEDRGRFNSWKASLLLMGIPLPDIMRIISAVLLLGNITFKQGTGIELEVDGNEIQSVAALLGVSGVALYKVLTMRTTQNRGQIFTVNVDAQTANETKNGLAKALYSRLVLAIVKRANSSKRPNCTSTASTSSNESNGHGDPQASPPLPKDTSILPQKTGALSRSSSFTRLSRISGEGFIGILDMFGFDHIQRNGLEQLCINLCSETLQHFYNTHIFKSTEEACIEEGIQSDMDVFYFENAPIVELISSQRTGLMSLLDAESILPRGNIDNYLHKIRIQHAMNKHFSESSSPECRSFIVKHYVCPVEYSVSDFISTNRDQLNDDVIWAFSKHHCNFGFLIHLFTNELKIMHENGHSATGTSYRVCPHLPPDVNSTLEQRGTLSLDFHTKLDNLLKTLVQTKPHFIRCLKSNPDGKVEDFKRECVVKQIRALQVLETLHLMAGGFPHRMRYRVFNVRYRLLVQPALAKSEIDKSYAETKIILDHFLKRMDENNLPYASAHWALGKKHIFLSESARQQFELLREQRQHNAATLLQASWKRRICMKNWPAVKYDLQMGKRNLSNGKQNMINGLYEIDDNCDDAILGNTFGIYGLDMERPPPIPATRGYTIRGNTKMSFPQWRIMKQTYSDLSMSGDALMKGAKIKVVGSSGRRGFLLVEYGTGTVHVPHQFTEIMGDKWEPVSRYSADV